MPPNPSSLNCPKSSFTMVLVTPFTQRLASCRVLSHLLVSLLQIHLLGTAVLCQSQLFPGQLGQAPRLSLILQECPDIFPRAAPGFHERILERFSTTKCSQ